MYIALAIVLGAIAVSSFVVLAVLIAAGVSTKDVWTYLSGGSGAVGAAGILPIVKEIDALSNFVDSCDWMHEQLIVCERLPAETRATVVDAAKQILNKGVA